MIYFKIICLTLIFILIGPLGIVTSQLYRYNVPRIEDSKSYMPNCLGNKVFLGMTKSELRGERKNIRNIERFDNLLMEDIDNDEYVTSIQYICISRYSNITAPIERVTISILGNINNEEKYLYINKYLKGLKTKYGEPDERIAKKDISCVKNPVLIWHIKNEQDKHICDIEAYFTPSLYKNSPPTGCSSQVDYSIEIIPPGEACKELERFGILVEVSPNDPIFSDWDNLPSEVPEPIFR